MEIPLEETTFLNRVVPSRLVLVCAIATLTPQSFYQCMLSPYIVHFSFFLVGFGASRCGIVRLFLARAVISFLFRLFFPKFQLHLVPPAVVVFRTKAHLLQIPTVACVLCAMRVPVFSLESMDS